MKVGTIILGLLLFFPFSVAHAQTDQLCQIVGPGRSHLAEISRRFESVSNVLKKNAIQQEYRQRQNLINSEIADFVTKNEISNFTGTVSYMDFKNYNTGPGLNLGIALPCNVTIAIQFVDITNPAWGGLNPQMQTQLSPWKQVLENISVKDWVTFSGKFYLRYGPPGIGAPNQLMTIEAVITNLRKGKGLPPVASPTSPSGGVKYTKDFIHNGVTIPLNGMAGNYILAGYNCFTDLKKCRVGPPGNFTINYDATQDSFTISIGEPLMQSRHAAEEFLLASLGITKAEMCGLKHFLSTTVGEDYLYAGKELGFSACLGAVALPSTPSNRHNVRPG